MKSEVLFFALFCASSVWAQIASDVPLLAWSGASVLAGRNVGLSPVLTPQDVDSLFTSVVQRRTIPAPFSTTQASPVELLVIFLEPHFQSTHLSEFHSQLPTIKNLLQNEKSSLFAPYLDLTTPLSNVILSAATATKKNDGEVLVVGSLSSFLKSQIPSVKSLSLATLKGYLESSSVFSNGKTDLLVVFLDHNVEDVSQHLTQSDEAIKETQAIVSGKTSSYIAVYTALSYEPSDLIEQFEVSAKRSLSDLEYLFEFLQDSNGTNGTNTTNGTTTNTTTTITVFQEYFPGWFWEAALMIIFILPIILFGFSFLMSVQAPEHYVVPHKNALKKRQ